VIPISDPLDEAEFTRWIGSALAAMQGLAISISIIGHTAHLRNSTITHRRLVGANARDVVSIIDSLARDKERHGGVWGVSNQTLGQIFARNGSWLGRTFSPVAHDLQASRARKPIKIMLNIEKMRRESTGHLPMFGMEDSNPTAINANDMWQAYRWIKEMLKVWLSRLDPPYKWFDERSISDEVLRHLSSPLVLHQDAKAPSSPLHSTEPRVRGIQLP
jgi:hypothetical protein